MINMAVIGTNVISERFMNAARLVKDVHIYAVYSRSEETGSRFAKQCDIPKVFTHLEEMARDEMIDAVYIASPNALHASQAITLMNHKKHVLCEKPIASNAREVQEMINASVNNKVALMEAVKNTLVPNFKQIQENLHKIGTIRRYVANYCQYSSRYDAYKEGTVLNAFNPSLSNGALMDIGIYCIYPMVVLFGMPSSLKAHGHLLEANVDGEGSILFDYEEMEGVVMYSKITNSHMPSEIQGEKGSMIIDAMNVPSCVVIHYNDGTKEEITAVQEDRDMYYEIEEFRHIIKNKSLESSINSHTTSLYTAKIMEKARKQIDVTYPADRYD
ncbi:Predicted dehydrogenase [Alteribacillus persepolensis]|uniref:Predicted dehydrogenase n=1 Tax=Alteribacillus persepolensis TaxID=568899 RepID=A0A1G8GX87_9BACI|nr:Gfo/Idh/MocA family oxidoreductase [Alteribacillus persepolensis]SDH99008.1 Predicted dehydrogenase [Alteribacillus persepolensis]